ncbi:MAG: sugar phosphate isomerase/epimerase [Tetrasphaera sp.]
MPDEAASGATALGYSLGHLTLLDEPPPELVRIAAEAGYDYVSIRSIYMGLPGEHKYDLAGYRSMREDTRQALADNGIRLHDIELARVCLEREPSTYAESFEVAAELGARAVLSSIWMPDRDLYLRRFEEVCRLADRAGLFVGLEYVPIAAVNTLPLAVDVLRTVAAPNAGLMLDMYHANWAHTDPLALDELPREWFRFTQICGATTVIPDDIEEVRHELREDRLLVSEGDVDIRTLLDRLPPMVYSIELPNLDRTRAMGPIAYARRCLEDAKSFLAAPKVPS